MCLTISPRLTACQWPVLAPRPARGSLHRIARRPARWGDDGRTLPADHSAPSCRTVNYLLSPPLLPAACCFCYCCCYLARWCLPLPLPLPLPLLTTIPDTTAVVVAAASAAGLLLLLPATANAVATVRPHSVVTMLTNWSSRQVCGIHHCRFNLVPLPHRHQVVDAAAADVTLVTVCHAAVSSATSVEIIRSI